MAAKTLLVKDTGSKVSVYTQMPEGAVAPQLYVEVPASKLNPLFVEKFAYAKKALSSKGRVTFGQRNTLKKQIRAAIKNADASPQQQAQPNTTPRRSRRSNTVELTLEQAREDAKRTGNWEQVVRMLDAKYGI